ncbi:MAG: DsbA family protein [Actinomycetota bacterium]|jgi:2-hydroxychromene-2-carboxylate isomerase
MADVTFFFEPVCPWTWRASRWLTTVAEARNLDVEWRPLSLLVLNDGPDEEHGADLEVTHRALRLVEHLSRVGRQAEIAALYGAFGQLAHEEGYAFDDDLVATAVRTAGLTDEGAALDDPRLDAGVRASTEEAVAAAGPGVGSPVMVVAGARRGLHGPVLKTVPDKRQALALWEAVEALAPIDDFFEIKRGRN